MENITQHIDQIALLCQQNRVKRLFAVGWVTTGDKAPNDNIDFLVEIEERDPISYLEIYRLLKLKLEFLYSRNVNLLEPTKIINPFLKKKIDHSKVALYRKI